MCYNFQLLYGEKKEKTITCKMVKRTIMWEITFS